MSKSNTADNTVRQPLPVEGYVGQIDDKITIINYNKEDEERTLRLLDTLAVRDDVDKRWLAIGRTHLETAWMAINRSIFKPERVKL